MGLNPFVQMAFGCAPLYIRLAAFLSAVSPNVNCGGSWYLNVTLELPQIFNLSSYVITAATTRRQRRQRRRTTSDTFITSRSWFLLLASLPRAARDVLPCSISTACRTIIACCSRCLFGSCSYLDRGSLSSRATGFRKPCSFRESSEDLQFPDGVILLLACHFGTFGSFISYRELWFLRWNRWCRSPKSEIERPLLLRTSVRNGLRYSSGHTVGHVSAWFRQKQRPVVSLHMTFDSLSLSQVGEKVILLYDIISTIFRRTFSPDISRYILSSRFSTYTYTHHNGVYIKINEEWRGIELFCATCV